MVSTTAEGKSTSILLAGLVGRAGITTAVATVGGGSFGFLLGTFLIPRNDASFSGVALVVVTATALGSVAPVIVGTSGTLSAHARTLNASLVFVAISAVTAIGEADTTEGVAAVSQKSKNLGAFQAVGEFGEVVLAAPAVIVRIVLGVLFVQNFTEVLDHSDLVMEDLVKILLDQVQ
jgi:hypothetical protein